jgi:ABC-type amino acid transport substrate-binding protein
VLRLTLTALVCCCLVACAGRATQADDLAAIRAAGSVRIGVKADAPPFGTRWGQEFAGFDIDIARAIADHLGVEPVFVPVTSADRFDRLLGRDIDLVVATTTITRSRERLVDFSQPYFLDGQGLVVPAASPVQGVADLTGGSTSIDTLRQVAPGAVVVEVGTAGDLLRAITAGEADAATSDSLILLGLRQGAADPAAWRVVDDRFSTEPYGVALRPDQSALRDAVNDAIQGAWRTGHWRGMYDAWFGPGTAFATSIAFAVAVDPP